jgi:hypothetical protein
VHLESNTPLIPGPRSRPVSKLSEKRVRATVSTVWPEIIEWPLVGTPRIAGTARGTTTSSQDAKSIEFCLLYKPISSLTAHPPGSLLPLAHPLVLSTSVLFLGPLLPWNADSPWGVRRQDPFGEWRATLVQLTAETPSTILVILVSVRVWLSSLH